MVSATCFAVNGVSALATKPLSRSRGAAAGTTSLGKGSIGRHAAVTLAPARKTLRPLRAVGRPTSFSPDKRSYDENDESLDLKAPRHNPGVLESHPPPMFNLFTKKNELFIGQLATMGFAASLLGERITGKGIVGQLNIETGLPITEIEPALAFFVVFLVGAALVPGTGVFEEDKKTSLRIVRGGGTQWYTLAKEAVLDRAAMILFAASIVLEHVSGQGPLAFFGLATGVEPSVLEGGMVFLVLLLTQQGATGRFVEEPEDDSWKDIPSGGRK